MKVSSSLLPLFALLIYLAGDNFKNPKIFNLTGHGKIRRKPLPDDGKSLRLPKASGYQLTQSASEPILELSSDMPSNKAEALDDNTTEPFPLYDSNYDLPFSSSPIAQSTPRIHVQPAFRDENIRVKSANAKLPSSSEIDINECFSDMDMGVDEDETTVAQRGLLLP